MLTDCPTCGQKLRPQWVRCPRCRSLLSPSAPEAPTAAVDVDASQSALQLWIAVASIAAILLVTAGVFMSRPDAVATAAAGASATPSVPPASTDTRAPDTAERSAAAPPFASLDSRRSARAAYAEGDFAAALTALEAAVAASPADAEARNDLGQLLVRQGRTAEALAHFDEAVRRDAGRWNYRFNRARTYGLLNRWDEAVAEYRIAAQLFPEDHATLYNLGLALLRVKDFAGAVTALEQAVVAAPEQHDFLITLGTAYVGAAQPDRARTTFERFLSVAPDDAEATKVKALLQALAESAP